MSTYLSIYLPIYLSISLYMYIYIYVCVCVNVCVCVCVCVCVFVSGPEEAAERQKNQLKEKEAWRGQGRIHRNISSMQVGKGNKCNRNYLPGSNSRYS